MAFQNLEEPEVQPGFQLESTYSELKNITDGPKLSIYGVIKSIVGKWLAATCSVTDYGFVIHLFVELDNGNLKLTLTDPSLNVDKHVICHLASDITGVLPRRAKVGDVLRLHRVSVSKLFTRISFAFVFRSDVFFSGQVSTWSGEAVWSNGKRRVELAFVRRKTRSGSDSGFVESNLFDLGKRLRNSKHELYDC